MTAVRDAAVLYARAGDVNIAYQVLGSGSIDLVYVPGMLNVIEATAEEPALERHLERMATFARMVMFDKRGTGLSDRVSAEEMADPESRLADLVAVMDAAELSEAALFATADGAIPAILFAAEHPERVTALVIVEGTARYLAADGYPEGFSHDPVAPLGAWNQRWGNEVDPIAVEVLAPSVADDPRWRRVLGRMQRRSGTPRAAFTFWRTFAGTDVRDALAGVRAPTLVMHAPGDRMIPVAQARALARDIPGARFVELDGADHFHWFTNGERVAAETQELLTGRRGGGAGARRLCTVVFTDIVASTSRLSEVGDVRWRDLLTSHERIVRVQLLRYGGREVNFLGDGVLALFEDPQAALECAAELTGAVRELGLEIRVGVHTGVVEVREADVAGMSIHIAARVMSAAGPSEVLVTRTVRDVMLGLDAELEPRGSHSLKGVPDPLELFALKRG
ncbi:MAG TPA: adenylate/guanylate cyclase domain-containing protein [Solirubrobacteraceae bacterium]|nr:adenylate/guanylate cyclase domain-containing protein [Solirubrobacteraceae bacterium]